MACLHAGLRHYSIVMKSPAWPWQQDRAPSWVRNGRAERQQFCGGWQGAMAAAMLLVVPSQQQSRLEGNRLEVK